MSAIKLTPALAPSRAPGTSEVAEENKVCAIVNTPRSVSPLAFAKLLGILAATTELLCRHSAAMREFACADVYQHQSSCTNGRELKDAVEQSCHSILTTDDLKKVKSIRGADATDHKSQGQRSSMEFRSRMRLTSKMAC